MMNSVHKSEAEQTREGEIGARREATMSPLPLKDVLQFCFSLAVTSGVLWFASRALLVIMWVLGLPLLKSMGLLPSSGRAENAVARFLIASTQAVLLVATLIVGWRVAKATKSYFVFFGVVAACAGAFVIAHLIGLL